MTHSTPAVAGMTWGWGAIFGLLNLLLGGGAFATWLKYRPAMQANKQSAEEKLRDDLIQRVEKLEQRLEEERTQHEAAMAMMRHRLNNSDQSIEALLLILDDDDLPEKLKSKVAKIRDLRERQKRAEEHERDTIRAAVVAAKTAAAAPPAASPAAAAGVTPAAR